MEYKLSLSKKSHPDCITALRQERAMPDAVRDVVSAMFKHVSMFDSAISCTVVAKIEDGNLRALMIQCSVEQQTVLSTNSEQSSSVESSQKESEEKSSEDNQTPGLLGKIANATKSIFKKEDTKEPTSDANPTST